MMDWALLFHNASARRDNPLNPSALWQFLNKLKSLPDSVTTGTMLVLFLEGAGTMPGEYSLFDVLERMYTNQLALEAALMELTLHVERQATSEVGNNVRGALDTIGENAGHIKQGLAKLRGASAD
jgi:hypothetical protein